MLHVLSCHPGREAPLIEEWARLRPNLPARVLGEGWVGIDTPSGTSLPDGLTLAFATQAWPDAQIVEAPSINAWAKRIAQAAIAHVSDRTPWRLHLFGHDHGLTEVNQRRLALIEAAVWTYLKQKQRRLIKSHVACSDAAWADVAAGLILNVGLTGPTTGILSAVTPAHQHALRHCLSPLPGGYVPLAEDPRPPARAYRKLREALGHLGIVPRENQTWVDLGAAPGSWSFDAVEAGARVWAVDRSPLRSDLMAAPNLTFVKADAFTYKPQAPVDILVCDVIAYPERNIALLETWLSEGLCHAFVVTLKFRGEDDYMKVDACKAVLSRLADPYIFRQLYHNKNEVTAAGWRRSK